MPSKWIYTFLGVVMLSGLTACSCPEATTAQASSTEPQTPPSTMLTLLPTPGVIVPYDSMDTYFDEGETIQAAVNEEFAIALHHNPRLGTGWQETHDKNKLTLIKSEFIDFPPSRSDYWTTYFTYKALMTGMTEINMTYYSLSQLEVDWKVFKVKIGTD